jgi:DNA-binding protein WhiA
MSFSTQVKEELFKKTITKSEVVPILKGIFLIKVQPTETDEKRKLIKLNFRLESVAKLTEKLLIQHYNIKIESIRRNSSFNLIIKSKLNEIQNELLLSNSTEILETGLSDIEKQLILRGCFAAGGSIADPITKKYHLEICAASVNTITYIQKICLELNLNAKITKKKNGYIVYLKNKTQIGDFLLYIGAPDSYLKLDEQLEKNQQISVAEHTLNLQTVNIQKTQLSYDKYRELIKKLDKKKLTLELDIKLYRVYLLLKNQKEISLTQLTDIYLQTYEEKISKSGLVHRINKLKKIATKKISKRQIKV